MSIQHLTHFEDFQRGRIGGFYDALPDEGARYLDDLLRYEPRIERVRSFLDGYCIGQRLRLGQTVTPVPSIG
jgi:hypothetical protein